ncbi:MAG: hypothetical protein HFE76_08710 [Firmicutes bacterium]|nr:hypothetical protein [Bacillota bacterium]
MMCMKQNSRKWITLLVAMFMVLWTVAPVWAQTTGERTTSEKEEVVYGELSGSGAAKKIYVVNIFENQRDILDYGNYSSVRNMTSQDKVNQKGDQITLQTKEDTLYYQGELENAQLPWDIEIAYFLNGETISPSQLAGKSGNLEIRIKIGENKKAFPAFFENYALQVTAALDMEKCRNIKTKGATEANAGGNRQLTWTLLPETSRTIKIRARVTDFEMEPISFNGVKLNIDVKVDNAQMEECFSQLSETVSAIDSGAKKLSVGTKDIHQGAERLSRGTGSLSKSIEELAAKTKDAEQLKTASGEIKGAAGALSQGISQIKQTVSYQAFKEVMRQKGLDLDSLKAGNQQLLGTLSSLKAMENIPQEYRQQIARAEQVLEGNLAALAGMEGYLTAAAQGVSEAETGAKELLKSYEIFDTAISTLCGQFESMDFSAVQKLKEGADSLAGGSANLEHGSSALSRGTGALKENTLDMSSRMEAAVSDMLSGISGSSDSDSSALSFVSEKNTNVKAVQFVIKNEPVEITEQEPPAEREEEPLRWWQKIVKLF